MGERVGPGEDGKDGTETARTRATPVFRERMARGEYAELFGPGVREVLEQAARESPLTIEIGALRVTLARLLAEEEDPSKLATAAARVAGVAIQATKVRQALGGGAEDELEAALGRMLDEL